jgi:hypothetical protein
MHFLAVFAVCAGTVACPPSMPPTTSLRLNPAKTAPAYAKVTIDDLPLGSLRYITKHGVALPPGKHRITIEADGFLPWDQEVEAGSDGGLIKLDVDLVKVPD